MVTTTHRPTRPLPAAPPRIRPQHSTPLRGATRARTRLAARLARRLQHLCPVARLLTIEQLREITTHDP